MTPLQTDRDDVQTVLDALDQAQMLPWPAGHPDTMARGYEIALAARERRVARGEQPVGYKIGFTNRTIWPRYGVYGPIWGTVYAARVHEAAQGRAEVPLDGLSQPRIEPEIVFGLRATPPPACSLDQLADCIDWVAHGFEIVHTHWPFWKFTAPQSVADFAMHGALVVGSKVRVSRPQALVTDLPAMRLELLCGMQPRDQGTGSNVLDGPLQALHYFVKELASTPGAPALAPGDLVTTGTITDAFAIEPGQQWSTRLEGPGLCGLLAPLAVTFTGRAAS